MTLPTSIEVWALIEPVANHLWQSTLFAAAVGLLTLAFRRNRAAVRHGLWLAASVKFLVPFAPLVAIGWQLGWRLAAIGPRPPMATVIDTMSQPFSQPALRDMAASPAAGHPGVATVLPILLVAVWLCGCAAILCVWWARWRRVAAVAREGTLVVDGRELGILRDLEATAGVSKPIALVSTDTSLEPGVFGIFGPVLLWPRSIAARLDDEQVRAILAHELAHVRRRDNLAATLHMFVEAVCWFHPLVWWLGARLVDERERACDEEVVRLGSEPQVYAESILKTCQFYVDSPLTCVAGVTGSDLKQRIEAIMTNRAADAMNGWKKLGVGVAAVLAVAVPVIVGVVGAPRVSAQSFNAPPAVAGGKPAFEVASVKRNAGPDDGGSFNALPGGRVTLVNRTVRFMIFSSYQEQDYRFVGGPDWLKSERFDVEAKAEGEPPLPERLGMVRQLLADRFKLVMHTETREMPIYTLVMARKDGRPGPQLKPSTCFKTLGGSVPLPDGAKACVNLIRPGSFSVGGNTIAGMAKQLGRLAEVGRPVVNRTELTGEFDWELVFQPDQAPGADPASDARSMFTALQEQLGLKLESGKGPVEVMVIDSVEHPSEN